jgi:hypothetical protein
MAEYIGGQDTSECPGLAYTVGNIISIEHQNVEFGYCYPSESTSTFSLSNHEGKVFVLDMAASW